MPSTPAQSATRSAAARAAALVLVGSIGVQISVVLAIGVFDSLGVLGTSSLRMAMAAVLLLAILRPSLRGRSRREWTGIVLYGAAMAAMNLLLYLAIDRIPLGIATTIDFLGPCIVALAASRHLREGLLAVLAFVGVAMIMGFGGPFDGLGIMFAALAGLSFGLYTLLAARIGKREGGLQSMALSVAVGAILLAPFGAPVALSARPLEWGILALSAAIGMALPFAVDTMAGRLTSARVIGVLFAFDPVVGTIVGTLWLGQELTPAALGGILLVVVAGAGIVWSAGRRSEAPGVGPAGRGAVESFEIERKYAVEGEAELPGAAAFAELGLTLDPPRPHRLEARYFDTPDAALAGRRVAVRMRRGGKDEGWHLKEKGAEGARELLWPPAEEPPAGLLDEIADRIGAAAAARLGAIATLRTVRTVTRVRDAAGVEVIELADDRVDARNELTGRRQRWREWEAELAPGADPEILDRIEPLLLRAGAARVRGTSKIQRTMSAEGLD